MDIQKLMQQIIPAEYFVFKDDASLLEQSQHLIDQCFPGATKMQIRSIDGQIAEASIPCAQENRALHGLMHGGVFFTVGDTLTAIMCMLHLTNENQLMLTRDASIRYLRPIRKETVRAEARLQARNNNQLDFVCNFYNEAGKRAAQAKFKYILTEMNS